MVRSGSVLLLIVCATPFGSEAGDSVIEGFDDVELFRMLAKAITELDEKDLKSSGVEVVLKGVRDDEPMRIKLTMAELFRLQAAFEKATKPSAKLATRVKPTYRTYVDPDDGLEVVEVVSPEEAAVMGNTLDSALEAMTRFGAKRDLAMRSQESAKRKAEANFFDGLDDDEDEEDADALPIKRGGQMEFETLPDPDSKEEAKPEPEVATVVKAFEPEDHDTAKVAPLNRVNFHTNVLTAGNDHVKNWIVRFCVDWVRDCERITEEYKDMARRFEDEINDPNDLQATIRFADVDCSENKELCNTQLREISDYYPVFIHYQQQTAISSWEPLEKGDVGKMLETWLEKRALNMTQAPPTSKDNVVDTATQESWSTSLATGGSLITVILLHIWMVARRDSPKLPARGIVGSGKADLAAAGPPSSCSTSAMLPESWVEASTSAPLIDL